MMRLTVVCLASLVVAILASPVPSVTSDKNIIENLIKGSVELESEVKLKGEQYWQSEDGEERGYAYYGYKYGNAGRFEDSVLNTDHSYLTNTSRPKLGYVCPHVPTSLLGIPIRNLTMNEDCLFLDVYVPPLKKDQQKAWPVLFWIYGGRFTFGDKDMYNASILTRAVDAIVVTVNYRLSAFGFLSTGDEAARGNWALGDLKLALNWTVANIASFNGDPKNITIFGVSAGGALTSALMLDKNVRLLYFRYKHLNIPPGPRGWPLLGYVPYFKPNPQETFMELGEKYGRIFSLYMGPYLTIILNDYESIKEAFVGQAEIFSGRAHGPAFSQLCVGDDKKLHGTSCIEGTAHKTGRNFTVKTLRDVITAKNYIMDEIFRLIETLRSMEGRPVDPYKETFITNGNIVSLIVFGENFDLTDTTYIHHLTDLQVNAKYLAQAGPTAVYSHLRYISRWISPDSWSKFEEFTKRSRRFFVTKVAHHRRTYDEKVTRGYIDAFSQQQLNEEDCTKGFNDEELYQNLRIFYAAGTGGTSTTIQWLYLYLLHNPSIQAKVHELLQEHIAPLATITLDDRVKLPYLEAVILETQRMGNVVPFGLARANKKETILHGYRIPERCFIFPNYLAVNMDPNLWDEPRAFRPNRFLDENGLVKVPPHFVPFGIGKRFCVGDGLAKASLFLIVANILQQFYVRNPAGQTLPSTTDSITDIACHPLPFEVEFIAKSRA